MTGAAAAPCRNMARSCLQQRMRAVPRYTADVGSSEAVHRLVADAYLLPQTVCACRHLSVHRTVYSIMFVLLSVFCSIYI